MGVYLTRGLSGPNPKPNGPRGQRTSPTLWPVGQVLSQFSLHLCGHMSIREEEGQGSGSRSTRPTSHVARPVGRHLACSRLGQVGGAPPRPYKYPLQWKLEHTHHYSEIPLA
jgi:hypothetical protein